VDVNFIKTWCEQNTAVFSKGIVAAGVLLLSFGIYLITKHYLVKSVKALIKRTRLKYDDLLIQEKTLQRLSYVAPLIVIYIFVDYFPFSEVLQKFVAALSAWFIILAVGALLSGFNEVYRTFEVAEGRSIKSYIQIACC